MHSVKSFLGSRGDRYMVSNSPWVKKAYAIASIDMKWCCELKIGSRNHVFEIANNQSIERFALDD